MGEHISKPIIKAFVVITDKVKTKKLLKIFNQVHAKFSYMFTGIGTANSEILDLFGLSGVEKTVSISLIPSFKIPYINAAINEELKFSKPGNGIAFTIPLSGIALPAFNLISVSEEFSQIKEGWEKQMEKEIDSIKKEAEHNLIISVIEQGQSEDLMEVAKKAGATGGTIIHARRVGTDEVVKFFGISVQEEKELVAIITPHSQMKAIMRAINNSFGVKSESKGIVFSLPLDSVFGLNSLADNAEITE